MAANKIPNKVVAITSINFLAIVLMWGDEMYGGISMPMPPVGLLLYMPVGAGALSLQCQLTANAHAKLMSYRNKPTPLRRTGQNKIQETIVSDNCKTWIIRSVLS